VVSTAGLTAALMVRLWVVRLRVVLLWVLRLWEVRLLQVLPQLLPLRHLMLELLPLQHLMPAPHQQPMPQLHKTA
jgi:hypothetical protein